MKKWLCATLLLACSYAGASDLEDVQNCLRHWGETPFSATPEFRIMTSKVRVMGIGDEMTDAKHSLKPELILIKPAVSVMSKSVMTLTNPNGWYCLKGKVDVLGKTEINLHCQAHLAASTDGATVMGSDDGNTGTTVLGKTVVTRVGCKTE